MKHSISLFILPMSVGLTAVFTDLSSAQYSMKGSCWGLHTPTMTCEKQFPFLHFTGSDGGGYAGSGVGDLGLGRSGQKHIDGSDQTISSVEVTLKEIHRFGGRIPGDDSLPPDPSPRSGETYGREQSERLEGCIKAVPKFRNNFSTTPKLTPETFDSYVDSCTTEITASDFLSTLLPGAVAESRETLRLSLIESVAKIELPDGNVCTVFIASKYHALTARHCYQDKPDKEIQDGSFGRLKGRDSQDNPYQIDSLKLASDPVSLNHLKQAGLLLPAGWSRSTLDFVILSPSDSSQTFKIVTPIEIKFLETLQEGTSLLLVSNFSLKDKDRGLRIDDLPSCRVVKYVSRKGFMKHRCQAVPGGSGAPMFLVQKTGVYMIGMHVGAEGIYSADNSLARDNEAILMPSDLSSWIKSSTSVMDVNRLPITPFRIGGGKLGFPMPHNYRPPPKSKIFIDPVFPSDSAPSMYLNMHSFNSKFSERQIMTPAQVR